MNRTLVIALLTLAVGTVLSAQPPQQRRQAPAPRPGTGGNVDAANWDNASAPSRVLKRGDLEILTFETEEDYDRLQELYRDTGKTQLTPGLMAPIYYRSKMDGSVQPYAIRLPGTYSPDRKYPMVIQLHGTNFHEVLSHSRLVYRGMGGPQFIHADLPVIYVHCFGGPTTFYQGMGEVDILQVIDEVERRFPIDPDRVYIMGHSMGGAGSYTVGLHYPDHFGGINMGDPAMFKRPIEGPEWMKPQIAIQSPEKLPPNGRNIDCYFKNAGDGIQRKSTDLADAIVAAGGFATTEVFPGMPHSFGDKYPYANFVPMLIAHPINHKPVEVKYYTNTLQYNHAYWVTIDRLAHHNADALVVAKQEEEAIHVTATNIVALTLNLGAMSGTLTVDGQEVTKGTLPDVVHLSKQSGKWQLGEWNSGPLAKRHNLQGPIGDAFNSRFLAVYGEGDRDLAIAELDAVRNPPGPLDIHADFPMKAASKVTSEDVASSNLILFGSAQSNAVLKRIASKLPASLLNGNTIFIYPNPESASHYVVVWSAKLLSAPDHGVKFGWTMPLNLLPDYVAVKDGKVASGGHFDSDWNLAGK
jgi:pimeloyl-ACP methyl ester carboxylesterase